MANPPQGAAYPPLLPPFTPFQPTVPLLVTNALASSSPTPGIIDRDTYVRYLTRLGHVKNPINTQGLIIPTQPQNSIQLQSLRGDRNDRYTDHRSDQALWSQDQLPDELYELEKPTGWLGKGELHRPPNKTYLIYGKTLRDIPILPDHISEDVEGWRIEAWFRLDSRIVKYDLLDRMPPAVNQQGTNFTKFSMRAQRFRKDCHLLGWTWRGRKFDTDLRAMHALVQAHGIDLTLNTTRGLSWGLVDPALGPAGGRILVPQSLRQNNTVENGPALTANLPIAAPTMLNPNLVAPPVALPVAMAPAPIPTSLPAPPAPIPAPLSAPPAPAPAPMAVPGQPAIAPSTAHTLPSSIIASIMGTQTLHAVGRLTAAPSSTAATNSSSRPSSSTGHSVGRRKLNGTLSSAPPRQPSTANRRKVVPDNLIDPYLLHRSGTQTPQPIAIHQPTSVAGLQPSTSSSSLGAPSTAMSYPRSGLTKRRRSDDDEYEDDGGDIDEEAARKIKKPRSRLALETIGRTQERTPGPEQGNIRRRAFQPVHVATRLSLRVPGPTAQETTALPLPAGTRRSSHIGGTAAEETATAVFADAFYLPSPSESFGEDSDDCFDTPAAYFARVGNPSRRVEANASMSVAAGENFVEPLEQGFESRDDSNMGL